MDREGAAETCRALWQVSTSLFRLAQTLEWYRFQLFIDLDKTNYWFYVYDIGSSSPATPGSFTDSNDPANAIVSGVTNGLTIPASGTYAGQGYEKYGVKVGAYGFVAWNNPDSDADYAILVDNVRCWKGDGNDGWDLVFQNDFSTAKRTFKRKSLKLLNTRLIDRPEYGEDGWTVHVSICSLGVRRPQTSPLPQELHGGLLRDRGKQVSIES